MQPFALLAAVMGLALLPAPAGPGPDIGQPAPAFTLLDVQGKPHTLAEYKGKVVVLEWVNITCPWGSETYKAGIVQAMQKKYAAKKDVVWLSMIITQRQRNENGSALVSPALADSMAKAMVEQYGASPTAILVDLKGKVGKVYDTRTSMHLFVVDRQGILVYDGALDDRASYTDTVIKQNYIASALDEVLAGRPVTTARTMPTGCHAVGPEGLDARWTDPDVYAKAVADEAAEAAAEPTTRAPQTGPTSQPRKQP